MLALEGFRVIDLTRFLAGPYCTMVLGDLGADVIKIEQPIKGDDSRRYEPKVNGESYPGIMPHRSKRSVSLDLKSEEGVKIFYDLLKDADLVIENFRPGVTKRLGIDYESVSRSKPDILYCSISGFGQTGPYKHRPGFDIMAQGIVGFMTMTGDGRRPAKMGVAVNDLTAGSTALYSILAAQLLRERTGEGQYIDVSIVDAGLAWTVWESGAYFGGGEVPLATGTRHRRSAPYQAYKSSDGFITIGANNDSLWRRLVSDGLEKPEWLTDPRFRTMSDRMANLDELEREIESITITRTTDEWIDILDNAGVPCGPVLTYDQPLQDPQVEARGMVTQIDHPIIGPMKTIAPPTKFSNMQYKIQRPAPWIGQHTAEVLREIGRTDAEIEEYFAQKVIYDARPDMQSDNDNQYRPERNE